MPFTGFKHSPESRERMRLAPRASGKDHPMWGRKHSPETLDKMMVMDAGQRAEVLALYRQGFTGGEIAMRLGVGPDPVYGWLKRNGVEMRKGGFRKGARTWNAGMKLNDAQKAKLNLPGLNIGHPWNKDKAGVYSPEYLEKLRVSHTGKNGEQSSNWKGGISFEPYSTLFNRQLKDSIRVRDNFLCQKCGLHESEHGRRLAVHHIDYDKKNCAEENLISLCIRCNCIVNGEREHWEKFFKAMTRRAT